jgi:hypothetical protein
MTSKISPVVRSVLDNKSHMAHRVVNAFYT